MLNIVMPFFLSYSLFYWITSNSKHILPQTHWYINSQFTPPFVVRSPHLSHLPVRNVSQNQPQIIVILWWRSFLGMWSEQHSIIGTATGSGPHFLRSHISCLSLLVGVSQFVLHHLLRWLNISCLTSAGMFRYLLVFLHPKWKCSANMITLTIPSLASQQRHHQVAHSLFIRR